MEWSTPHNNKMEIKYFDQEVNAGCDPLQFFVDLYDSGLLFNRLVLVESSFASTDWNKFVYFIQLVYTPIIKKVRLWDVGLCQSDIKTKKMGRRSDEQMFG